MKRFCAAGMVAAALAMSGCALNQSTSTLTATQLTQDFDLFCTFITENYAYFDLKKTDWPRACASYRERASLTIDRRVFVTILEGALGELYDAHAHLGTSTTASPRLIPTNTDVWAAWKGDKATIVEVRADSAAFNSGVRAGMTVLAVNDQPVHAAAFAREPRFLTQPDSAAREWALQSALAGHQNGKPVRLTLAVAERIAWHEFNPDAPRRSTLLSHRRAGSNNGIGIIRLNNSLGEGALVKAFDDALDTLRDTRALVLDLRDTPSGGNTTVARGIMGRLVAREAMYQRHEAIGEFRSTGVRRAWTEFVFPRAETYRAPVVVLVGRWTGSMGEGIAIGLHAAREAPVLGSAMARLLGAIEELKLPNTGIVVRIPTEKLFSTDGNPRESFVPCAPDQPRGAAGASDDLLDATVGAIDRAGDKVAQISEIAKALGCR